VIEVAASWKQVPPSPGNIEVSPGFHNIGTCSDDNVQMVAEHSETQDVQSEDGGQFFKSLTNPFFSMGEVFTGFLIVTAQMRSADTTVDQVKDLYFLSGAYLGSIESWHGQTPEVRWVNASVPKKSGMT
jgi:hypothetical protein